MIIDGLLTIVRVIILWILDFLPDVDYAIPDLSLITSAQGLIYVVMTPTTFAYGISSLVFWIGVQFVYATVMWVIKKIPAVNIS